MLKNFRAYQLSVEFYRHAQRLAVPQHLREQLRRAASSICLNLAEGSGRSTPADQRRFYTISLGSLRKCEAILTLADEDTAAILSAADKLGAYIFKLIRSRERFR
jgi:four helix bundle protein